MSDLTLRMPVHMRSTCCLTPELSHLENVHTDDVRVVQRLAVWAHRRAAAGDVAKEAAQGKQRVSGRPQPSCDGL